MIWKIEATIHIHLIDRPHSFAQWTIQVHSLLAPDNGRKINFLQYQRDHHIVGSPISHIFRFFFFSFSFSKIALIYWNLFGPNLLWMGHTLFTLILVVRYWFNCCNISINSNHFSLRSCSNLFLLLHSSFSNGMYCRKNVCIHFVFPIIISSYYTRLFSQNRKEEKPSMYFCCCCCFVSLFLVECVKMNNFKNLSCPFFDEFLNKRAHNERFAKVNE